MIKVIMALPSWCFNCNAITGTKKEKQGKGQSPKYYCSKCGQEK